MQALDLARFLIGDEGAIRRLAADRASLPVGAFLVLTTVVAREHDEADLLADPQLWGLGLVLSLAVAVVLHFVLRLLCRGRWSAPPELRVMVAMVWLTAPLAWFYAIPVERWLDPLPAAQANVALLAVVALWRALLLTRVADALTGAGSGNALAAIFTPAVAAFGVALATMPGRTLNLMSGSRHLTPAELFTAEFKFFGPLVAFLAAAVLVLELVRRLVFRGAIPARVEGYRAGGSTAVPYPALIACALAFAALAAVSQPPVRRAHAINRALAANDLATVQRLLVPLAQRDWPPRVSRYPDVPGRNRYQELKRLLESKLLDALPADHWYRAETLALTERLGLKAGLR